MIENTKTCRICKYHYGNDIKGYMTTLMGRVFICRPCNDKHFKDIEAVCQQNADRLIAFLDILGNDTMELF